MRPLHTNAMLAVLVWLVIALTRVSATPAPIPDDTTDGCPASDPTPFPCEPGQSSYYIPQNSVQCAHYICQSDANSSDNNSDSSNSKKSVLLPAVLGSVIPLAVICGGVVFFFHRRHRKQRANDALHGDAQYMSSYNNLIDDNFMNGPRSPGAYSSTYSVSKWRDSAMNDPAVAGSHASIPIIFSTDHNGGRETKLFDGDEASGYRETKLYNAGAQNEKGAQWAAPNVVNLKQKPQLVVLNGNTTAAAAGLELNTKDLNAQRSVDGTSSDSDSPATPLTPDTPMSVAISEVATPVGTQKPRIVQVGRPQIIRNMELGQNGDGQIPSSPLRVAANGWDSETEGSEYYSDNDGSGSESEESGDDGSGSESEESETDSSDSEGSDISGSESSEEDSGDEEEEEGQGSGSEVSENEGGSDESEEESGYEEENVSEEEASEEEHTSDEESADESGVDVSEYNSNSEYDEDSEESADESEDGSGNQEESDDDDDDDDDDDEDENSDVSSDSSADSSDDETPGPGPADSRPESRVFPLENDNRLSLGPGFKLETSELDSFSSDLLSAAQKIGI